MEHTFSHSPLLEGRNFVRKHLFSFIGFLEKIRDYQNNMKLFLLNTKNLIVIYVYLIAKSGSFIQWFMIQEPLLEIKTLHYYHY